MLLQVLDSDAKLPPTFKDELYQAIAAASGAVQKEEAKARAAVSTGEERSGTGPFDNLTMEAHVNIFSALGLRDRLTVSIAVCKAWRAFRTQLELWRDIGGLSEGDNRYRSRAWVHGRGMIRLMSWLPTNAAHTLSIAMHNKHDDKAIDAASICAAMKVGAAALFVSPSEASKKLPRRTCAAGRAASLPSRRTAPAPTPRPSDRSRCTARASAAPSSRPPPRSSAAS